MAFTAWWAVSRLDLKTLVETVQTGKSAFRRLGQDGQTGRRPVSGVQVEIVRKGFIAGNEHGTKGEMRRNALIE
jgi:hypothetical protein